VGEESSGTDGAPIKHYVFLIHGTWGRDPQGWYRVDADGSFAERLASRLVGAPLEGALWRDIEVFEWSGDNTHEARMAGANDLAQLLLRMRLYRSLENVRFHFVAHSHGGNVLLAALPIYIADLPAMLLNAMRFPRWVSDQATAAQFFDAARHFRAYVASRSGPGNVTGDQRLIEDVKQWVKRVEAAHTKFLSLTPGTFWELNKLLLLSAYILLRLGTYPIGHGIASAVFLGTPFYYKRWRADVWRRAVDRVSTAVAEAALLGAGAYLALLAGAGFLSWLSPVAWIGFNPARWPMALQALVGVASLAGVIMGTRRLPGSADTNVYFDETMFLERQGTSPLTELGGRRLFDALVVTAGYLDEAYSGLSSFPLMEQIAPRLVDRILAPRPWTFVPLPRAIGTVKPSPGQRLRRGARGVGRRLRAVALLLLYPARFIAYKLVTRPIVLSQTKRFTQPVSFGLPPDELDASDIIVKDRLEVPQIDARHLDVSKDLVGCRRDVRMDERRFDFLWDDRTLAARYGASAIAAHVPDSLAADDQRHLLAIEERLREFFGVAGFRHSHYYESDRVIDAVAEYLLRDVPGAETASPDEASRTT
jgi:hypothetical protein